MFPPNFYHLPCSIRFPPRTFVAVVVVAVNEDWVYHSPKSFKGFPIALRIPYKILNLTCKALCCVFIISGLSPQHPMPA